MSEPKTTQAARERAAAARDAEDAALAYLQRHGLKLLARNYRVARGPSRPAGEIDLVMRDRDGSVVFVEVRARADSQHGGAAATVGPTKQRRLILAAQHYLLQFATPPACRFDVVAVEGGRLQWLPAAFDAQP